MPDSSELVRMINSPLAPGRLTCWQDSTPNSQTQKAAEIINEINGLVVVYGRDGVIRTLDPLHPMQVRYRAALRPDYVFRLWLKTRQTIP